LAIEWDSLIVEMVLFAAIIYFSVYLEHWAYSRSQRQEGKRTRMNIMRFIRGDLERRLRFINESLQYKDFKLFFTDMWDAVVLAGKHALLHFELFQSLHSAYSWMKYYNSELESSKRNPDEKVIKELLEDVRKEIDKSLAKLKEADEQKMHKWPISSF
jgi:hypothetical protein